MKMVDKIRDYDKEDVFNSYIRIIDHYKSYDKISKMKMLDEIYKFYQDGSNIIDICTEKELKYLKRLIDGDMDCQDRNKYSFEVENLSNKYLIYVYPVVGIPEEIYDNVCLALKKVKWKEVKEKDRINEVLVGICKTYGEIMASMLVDVGIHLLGLDKDTLVQHLGHNRMFKYYVYFDLKYNEMLDKEMPVFVYHNYFYLLDELYVARKDYGFSHTKEICIEDYINIFWYGFNLNRKCVKKFYDYLLKNKYSDFIFDFIRETVLLNSDRENLIGFIKQFIGEDKKFFELMNVAMDEMPSGALYGATLNDWKYNRLEKERNEYKREVQYVKQSKAKLTRHEAKTFYQVYFALLEFTNIKYQVNSKLKKIYKQTGLNPSELNDIIEKFWEVKDVIIDEFLEKNPYHFGDYEKSLVLEMKKGFRDMFVVIRFEEEYTCFLCKDKCYMVKGINDNIDNIIPYKQLPLVVVTSILPFQGKIIYDGVFRSVPGISLGVNFDSLVNEEYDKMEKIYRL